MHKWKHICIITHLEKKIDTSPKQRNSGIVLVHKESVSAYPIPIIRLEERGGQKISLLQSRKD